MAAAAGPLGKWLGLPATFSLAAAGFGFALLLLLRRRQRAVEAEPATESAPR